MRNLTAGGAGPTFLASVTTPAGDAIRSRPECVSKLVLSGTKDRLLIESVGGYPPRLQSCVLAAWLRGGWQLTRTGPGRMRPIPPPARSTDQPAQRLTRRICFDDPADPTLAGFLCSLPRKERGREIRHFILTALRSGPPRAA